MAKDYYQVLGVGRNATPAEIKAAFRRLARETHPDANPDNPAAGARFRESAEAYEVLSDPERRRRYDRGDTIDLSDLLEGFGGGFEDILRSVFGEGGLFGGGSSRPARGRDILVGADISLEQAAFGCDIDIEYHSHFDCASCSGSGARAGAMETCSTCGGAGSVRVARRSIVGTMMTVTDCPDCAGFGRRIVDPCPECNGRGVISGERTVVVEIPPGVSTGTRLRLTGRGESVGQLGRAGDLHVELSVKDDSRFERTDTDLIHRVSVGVVQAILGAQAKVPLLDGGAIDLEIPPGTQPGTVFRLDGQGVPHLGRRGRGDLMVVVEVEIPTGLTDGERELPQRFEGLRSESSPDTNPAT
jgi:molecular chaperone DnaJ